MAVFKGDDRESGLKLGKMNGREKAEMVSFLNGTLRELFGCQGSKVKVSRRGSYVIEEGFLHVEGA